MKRWIMLMCMGVLVIGASGCRTFMKSIGESDCAESGYVAEADTVLRCVLGEFSLNALDTFLIERGKPKINRFVLDCKVHALSESAAQITIGLEPDAPPMFFMENGRKKGFDYDLLKLMTKTLFPNASLITAEFGYDELPGKLLNKQVDIIGGGYVADESLKGIDWTEPYLTFGLCMVTNLGQEATIKHLEDLRGKRVGVYDDGETREWLMSQVKDIDVVEFVDNTETKESDWMQALVNREVDAIVYDYPFAACELKDYHGDLVISNKNIAPDEVKAYAFGIPCGNTALLKKINAFITDFKASADYAQWVATYIPNPDADKMKEMAESLKGSKGIYIVKAGETLSTIARTQLGDAKRYREIYELNRERVASPDIIYVGTPLIIRK